MNYAGVVLAHFPKTSHSFVHVNRHCRLFSAVAENYFFIISKSVALSIHQPLLAPTYFNNAALLVGPNAVFLF